MYRDGTDTGTVCYAMGQYGRPMGCHGPSMVIPLSPVCTMDLSHEVHSSQGDTWDSPGPIKNRTVYARKCNRALSENFSIATMGPCGAVSNPVYSFIYGVMPDPFPLLGNSQLKKSRWSTFLVQCSRAPRAITHLAITHLHFV
jgi:hypothetical protein